MSLSTTAPNHRCSKLRENVHSLRYKYVAQIEVERHPHTERSCCCLGLSVTVATRRHSWVVSGNMLKAFALPHQRSLQDDPALLVTLTFLRGELVHPAQFAVAVLAADVPHHVSPCQHHSVLNLTVLQIHNLETSSHIRWSPDIYFFFS